ncbi:protein of unknown function [Cryptosporangium aurantiacum]|uniref:DUF397 domain-containing protein n=2 Tax=Cryptosporangium aurantiacum TaxID=134849 RepID=A0A1M7QML9_9ACTN|nr:protein of unknown function [Cryptosporangium aurantiacum]
METSLRFEGVAWRKSASSGLGNCVEVTSAPMDGLVGMRDTKDRGGVVLAIPTTTWVSFLSDLKAGRMR